MANLEEFTTYKNTLMQALCTNDAIVNLLKNDDDPADVTGRDFRYTRIFPYNYVPNTVERTTTFICFAVTAPNVRDNVVTLLQLNVWVFTHQDLMRTKDGMRTDLLVSEIDKILNGSTKYGLGKVKLKSCVITGVPCEGYVGLVSTYTVEDFNRMCGNYD